MKLFLRVENNYFIVFFQPILLLILSFICSAATLWHRHIIVENGQPSHKTIHLVSLSTYLCLFHRLLTFCLFHTISRHNSKPNYIYATPVLSLHRTWSELLFWNFLGAERKVMDATLFAQILAHSTYSSCV